MVISKETIIFHGFRGGGGGNICQGGPTFSRDVQMLISKKPI